METPRLCAPARRPVSFPRSAQGSAFDAPGRWGRRKGRGASRTAFPRGAWERGGNGFQARSYGETWWRAARSLQVFLVYSRMALTEPQLFSPKGDVQEGPPRLQSRVSHHLRLTRRAPHARSYPHRITRSIPRPPPLLRLRPRAAHLAVPRPARARGASPTCPGSCDTPRKAGALRSSTPDRRSERPRA